MYKEPSEDRKAYLKDLFRVAMMLPLEDFREISLNIMIYQPQEDRSYWSNLALETFTNRQRI